MSLSEKLNGDLQRKNTHKEKWIEDIVSALRELGGRAHLSRIYKSVKLLRSERGDALDNLEATIRNTLQINSRGKGADLFDIVYPIECRKGEWKLKQQK
jgi:hypothetical protein